jgi:hypothetical protein
MIESFLVIESIIETIQGGVTHGSYIVSGYIVQGFIQRRRRLCQIVIVKD